MAKIIEDKFIVVPVYYTYDNNGNVIIDEDSITEEFEQKYEEILKKYLIPVSKKVKGRNK